MGAGWLSGKRYGRTQVAAVVLLTGGVLVSAWADAEMKVCNITFPEECCGVVACRVP